MTKTAKSAQSAQRAKPICSECGVASATRYIVRDKYNRKLYFFFCVCETHKIAHKWQLRDNTVKSSR